MCCITLIGHKSKIKTAANLVVFPFSEIKTFFTNLNQRVTNLYSSPYSIVFRVQLSSLQTLLWFQCPRCDCIRVRCEDTCPQGCPTLHKFGYIISWKPC